MCLVEGQEWMQDGGHFSVGLGGQIFCLVEWMERPSFLFGRVDGVAKFCVWLVDGPG